MEIQRYTAADLPTLFDKITKNSIGYDFDSFWNTTQTSYPPYNLIHISNEESRLEIALAGFKKDDVKVYTEYGKIYVEGSKKDKKMMERMSIKDWQDVPSNVHGRSPMIQRLDPSALTTDSLVSYWER